MSRNAFAAAALAAALCLGGCASMKGHVQGLTAKVAEKLCGEQGAKERIMGVVEGVVDAGLTALCEGGAFGLNVAGEAAGTAFDPVSAAIEAWRGVTSPFASTDEDADPAPEEPRTDGGG